MKLFFDAAVVMEPERTGHCSWFKAWPYQRTEFCPDSICTQQWVSCLRWIYKAWLVTHYLKIQKYISKYNKFLNTTCLGYIRTKTNLKEYHPTQLQSHTLHIPCIHTLFTSSSLEVRNYRIWSIYPFHVYVNMYMWQREYVIHITENKPMDWEEKWANSTAGTSGMDSSTDPGISVSVNNSKLNWLLTQRFFKGRREEKGKNKELPE